MEPGDMIVLMERYRKIYSSRYHVGVVLRHLPRDPYFGAKRILVLWCCGETGEYVESTLEDAWEIIIDAAEK